MVVKEDKSGKAAELSTAVHAHGILTTPSGDPSSEVQGGFRRLLAHQLTGDCSRSLDHSSINRLETPASSGPYVSIALELHQPGIYRVIGQLLRGDEGNSTMLFFITDIVVPENGEATIRVGKPEQSAMERLLERLKKGQ